MPRVCAVVAAVVCCSRLVDLSADVALRWEDGFASSIGDSFG